MSCTRRSKAKDGRLSSGWSASNRLRPRKLVALLAERLAFLVAIATGDVVVDHAGRLHVRVDDRAADEAEAALLELLAERVGLRRSRRHLLLVRPAILQRLAADEGPQVLGEAAVLRLEIQVRTRVGDGRGDLEPVAHDVRILQQPRDVA